MKKTATYHRVMTATSFVAAAVLMFVSVLLQPEFDESYADRLAAIDAAGAPATISALAFALAQVPFVVAMLGGAHLLRSRAPILSNLVATFGLLGGFGHAVFGGVSIVMVQMAADEPNRAAHAAVLAAGESGPGAPFMAFGLLGTVLGLLLLAIGLGRAKVGPRWLPYVLGAFLLVEFVGTNFLVWASSLSGALYLGAFVTLAVVVVRTPVTDWFSGPSAGDSTALAGQRAAAEPQVSAI